MTGIVNTTGTRSGIIGTGLYTAVIADVKAEGAEGGAAVADTWTARDLNTEISDDDNIVTDISSPNFTLCAGTFFIQWQCPFFKTGRSVSRLYDVTAGSVIAIGSATYLYSVHASGESKGAKVVTRAANQYRIDYYADDVMASDGLGLAHDVSGTSSIYTIVYIHKI